MSQMTTKNDIIILEGPMKKKVATFFSTKWVTRYYLLSTNTLIELMKQPPHGMNTQKLLENNHETKSISWPIKSVSVIAPLYDSQDNFILKKNQNSSLKIVFEDGDCLQLITPEPKAAALWIRNIQKQKAIKERESITQQSVIRVMDDVENHWDENMDPFDRNIIKKKVAKKFFDETPLQLQKLVIDDDLRSTTSWERGSDSFLIQPKNSNLKRQAKQSNLLDVSPTHFDPFPEPKEFAKKLHKKDTQDSGDYTPLEEALTPRTSVINLAISESPIPLRESISKRASSSRRRRKSNMAFMTESLEDFIKLSSEYQELQKKDFHTQQELKENETRVEELLIKLNDTNNIIEELKNQADCPDAVSQHQEILEREEKLKMERQKIIESQKATIRADMEHRERQKTAKQLLMENKKLEEIQKKKKKFIEEQSKKMEQEEKDIEQRDLNMTREMQQLKQKIEEYNQRVNQLNQQQRNIANAERKLQQQKLELEKKAKKIYQSQTNTLDVEKNE